MREEWKHRPLPVEMEALLEQNKKGNNINEKTHLLNSYYVLGAMGEGSLIRYHTYTHTRPQECRQQTLSTYCVLGLGGVQGSCPSTDYTPWGLCFISCLYHLISPKNVPTKASP